MYNMSECYVQHGRLQLMAADVITVAITITALENPPFAQAMLVLNHCAPLTGYDQELGQLWLFHTAVQPLVGRLNQL